MLAARHPHGLGGTERPAPVPRPRTGVSRHLREWRVVGRATLRAWEFGEAIRGPSAGHHGVELAWLHEGTGSYHIGTNATRISAGELVLLPATIEHGSAFAAGTRCGAIEVTPELVRDVAGVLPSRIAPRAITTLPLAGCASIVRALEEELALEGPGQVAATESLVEALLLRVLRVAGIDHGPTERDPRIARAVELVHERYADALSIDDLARAAGMSRFHFSRAFRAATGLAPYAYLQRHRIERAAAQLERAHARGGENSVTTIAFACGFRDLGRFARAFRARFGVAPSAFRSSSA